MSDWVEATALTPLKRRKKMFVRVADQDVALFYVNGQVYALNDICIHKQSRLSRGLVFKGSVICPGHQWAFDLNTGWAEQWSKCQPTYAVKVEGDTVYIDPEPLVCHEAPPAEDRFGGENG